jgi:hypothetical protein
MLETWHHEQLQNLKCFFQHSYEKSVSLPGALWQLWWDDRSVVGTKMTAVFSAVDWYHCHPATATARGTAMAKTTQLNRFVIHSQFFFHTSVFGATQPPPQAHSAADFSTIRTALISSIDCHHCHPATATAPRARGVAAITFNIFHHKNRKFRSNFTATQPPPQSHSAADFSTIRTALISSIK